MPTNAQINSHSFRMSQNNIFDTVNTILKSGANGSSILIPHICGNINTFKNGFAKNIADLYPEVEANFLLLGQNFIKTNPGHVQFINIPIKSEYRHKLIFVNMICHDQPSKLSNKRLLNYGSLVKCMSHISIFIKNNIDKNVSNRPLFQIHAPKFGCGFSGGNWSFISDLIDDIWGDYTTFIYQPNNTFIKK